MGGCILLDPPRIYLLWLVWWCGAQSFETSRFDASELATLVLTSCSKQRESATLCALTETSRGDDVRKQRQNMCKQRSRNAQNWVRCLRELCRDRRWLRERQSMCRHCSRDKRSKIARNPSADETTAEYVQTLFQRYTELSALFNISTECVV